MSRTYKEYLHKPATELFGAPIWFIQNGTQQFLRYYEYIRPHNLYLPYYYYGNYIEILVTEDKYVI